MVLFEALHKRERGRERIGLQSTERVCGAAIPAIHYEPEYLAPQYIRIPFKSPGLLLVVYTSGDTSQRRGGDQIVTGLCVRVSSGFEADRSEPTKSDFRKLAEYKGVPVV